ncbi:ribosomal protein S18-alanine N-acetyltransferase [Saccharomonospora sp. NB11]|uniref:ribosomal protein S18-alanine N-acetyltransferase n=1 Tax=Saccharomonospora sp. NB11 TaxID=1642298 RepID=UPI0018D18943|nr:ribosomal protein S18-alanine N-acetyltransferase [Saccharomonospora sp. NB11]
MRLEPLRRSHIRACVEIERMLFAGDGPWSAHAFHAELDAGGYYLAALDDDDRLVGYGGLAVVGRPGDWETGLHTIAVHPDHQGAGVGTALLRALLARADELSAAVFLEVRTDNDVAITLYERHGFERVGVRRRYYQPSGADAYTMVRPARRTQEVAG